MPPFRETGDFAKLQPCRMRKRRSPTGYPAGLVKNRFAGLERMRWNLMDPETTCDESR